MLLLLLRRFFSGSGALDHDDGIERVSSKSLKKSATFAPATTIIAERKRTATTTTIGLDQEDRAFDAYFGSGSIPSGIIGAYLLVPPKRAFLPISLPVGGLPFEVLHSVKLLLALLLDKLLPDQLQRARLDPPLSGESAMYSEESSANSSRRWFHWSTGSRYALFGRRR